MSPPPSWPVNRVVWTHAAERRLQDFVNRSEGSAGSRVGRMIEIDTQLAAAFPEASLVIVLDLFLGFQPQPGEYVLLVDIRDRDRGGTAVVKLGPDPSLRAEADAWDSCRPAGFHADSVFMEQNRRYHPDHPHRVIAVVYQDAQRHIGTGRLVSLEQAFIGAVRFGTPSVESVAAAIRGVFRRLGENLYVGAGQPQPLAPGGELNPGSLGSPRRVLRESLPRWEQAEPASIRRRVSIVSGTRSHGFRDPVWFFGRLLADLDAGRSARWESIQLHRGPAHGDLHGRNILVGVSDHKDAGTTDNQAEQPALFDYEHMTRDNLIGWDFVKLETELKIRAYRHAFPYTPPADALPPVDYLEGVMGMEQQLAELDTADRSPTDGVRPAQKRLFALLREIRQIASEHLGANRQRHVDWAKEYHFLLAAYGVYTVWFRHRPNERAAAFISAGTSASRLP